MPSSVNDWITKFILGDDAEKKFTMFWHGNSDGTTRPDKKVSPLTPMVKPGDGTIFADGFPYMMLSKESVEGLNRTLKEAGRDLVCEPLRFRPNIVVKGKIPESNLFLNSCTHSTPRFFFQGVKEPHAEDGWKYIRINENVILRNIKLCIRCIFTTVDPEAGIRHKQMEPLKTMRTFRSVFFLHFCNVCVCAQTPVKSFNYI